MKKVRIFLLIALLAAAVGAAIMMAVDPYRAAHRRTWKDRAIANIAQRTDDPKWLANELGRLKEKGGSEPEFPETWLSTQLVLTRNGDWIAYANICRKEDWRIDDMFIGKGSDGRWYFSTYHFCIGMIVLRMNDQPASLDDFVKAYYLRSFDGRSDVCLQTTWPLPGRMAKSDERNTSGSATTNADGSEQGVNR